jgi:hypothetical protein
MIRPMTFLKAWYLTSLFAILLLGSACTRPDKPDSSGGATGAATGDAQGLAAFLVTDYAPLSKWLDERFEVDYKHMTPQLIFDQVPLNDIYYETSNLPSNGTPFNFSSKDISRRELLKRIADHWNLKMSLASDASGKPSAVKVEG